MLYLVECVVLINVLYVNTIKWRDLVRDVHATIVLWYVAMIILPATGVARKGLPLNRI